jgi:hypothetical protein
MDRQNLPPHELARSAVDLIVNCAGRRVRGLIASYCDNVMIVRGIAESYHAWQLAIAACRESLAASPAVRLDCRLHVSSLPGKS